VKGQSLELRREDISDLSKSEDIERLFRQLNQFGTGTSSALKKGLTFTDNLLAFTHEIDFYMGSEGTTLSLTAPMTATDTNCLAWKADTGFVQLEGRVTRGGAATGSTVTTLAREYWPHRALYFSVPTSLVTAAEVDISAAGVVTVQFTGAPTWFALDGIAYISVDHRPLPNPGFPITFKNELAGKAKPLGVWVWQAWDMNDRDRVPTTAGAVAWELSSKGDNIVIRDIANLPHERKYRVRLVVVAG
jgi:hypothetical protein